VCRLALRYRSISNTRAIPMSDFLTCPCSGGTLDKLIQPAILAALSEEPAHGHRIAEKIREMPNFLQQKPDVSGIYRFLKTMESKGLVVSSWDTPDTGHAKRLYEITTTGQACLARWVKTLDGYLTAITALLEVARAAATERPRERVRSSRKRTKRPAAAKRP
jgi:PadR family transcriptional regulator, regulatory protein PadR